MDNEYISYQKQVAYRINYVKKADARVFHQAKQLLTFYRRVVWSVEHDLNDLNVTANEFGSRRIQNLVDYLSLDFEGELNKDLIGDRISSLADTRDLITIIDKALCRLKTYPLYGELYFSIINRKYIIMNQLSDQELMASLSLEKTTFYKRTKEAINLMGVILWGYILPDMMDASPEHYLVCADSNRELYVFAGLRCLSTAKLNCHELTGLVAGTYRDQLSIAC